ncbi:hypothetical protein BT69DRAFT_525268 [Atractiella rhizophila]|nr:hypothetical protein BT69DRAFT_525268 [Atractiella rhizophila]
MSIHKVSGSLTNAVFFVSSKPIRITTSPDESPITPQTVLLRVYGPSSGSLISRQSELHVLHTLSSSYGIGPAVFGTFANGRVEEYFQTRALHKEELRLSRVSRWIARRMRELHRVELDKMEVPVKASSSNQSRPPLSHGEGKNWSSAASILSTSSGSSVYSFTSDSSTSSGASLSTLRDGITASPLILPMQDDGYISRASISEGRSVNKKRSRSVGGSKKASRKLGVWENITRWTREARKVLKMVDGLKQDVAIAEANAKPSEEGRSTPPLNILSPLPIPKSVLAESSSGPPTPVPRHRELAVGSPASSNSLETAGSLQTAFEESSSPATASPTSSFNEAREFRNPLSTPADLIRLCDDLELDKFVLEIRKYRAFVKSWEKANGRSKRVFAHNDTQYGNLLLRTPTQNLDLNIDYDQEKEEQELVVQKGLRFPHEMIIVVDFEYSSPNARAFDIGNHFIEWQADYHHPQLSHSLVAHGSYPTWEERRTFFRAYIGCDGGPLKEDVEDDPTKEEDPRVLRLEEEVKVWGPSSHAMWAVWGIIQSMSDVEARIEKWNASPNFSTDEEVSVEFNYLSYSLCRLGLFRKALVELGIQ